jgi:hypothetical protein
MKNLNVDDLNIAEMEPNPKVRKKILKYTSEINNWSNRQLTSLQINAMFVAQGERVYLSPEMKKYVDILLHEPDK